MSGVVAGYRGAPAVLNGLDSCLLSGSVIGIVGRNGGWENDVCRCMAGLLQGKGGGDRGRRRAASRKETGGARVPGYARTGIQLFSSTVDDELASACSSDGAEDNLGNKDRIAAIKAALLSNVLPTGTRSPFQAGSANGFPSLLACFRVPAR